MIRKATIEDLDMCSRMALEFIRMTAYALFYDEGRVVTLVKHFLQETDQNTVILIDSEGRGMLAGAKTPFFFGNDYIATEVAWWVDLSHRGTSIGTELLEAFEEWARDNACRQVVMVAIDDTLGNYYEKKGYKLYERAYMKDLWQQ